MRELVATLALGLSFLYVPLALAAGPVSTPPGSVATPPPAPPPSPPPPTGLGTVNPFATLPNPGSTSFQPGVANPFDNPHPMLPWGDGQIGGQRYGPVVRYWQQQPEIVYSVVLVGLPEEEPTSGSEPQSQPGTPLQGALVAKAKSQPKPQDVTVPGSWIAETTRGYVHMPRWALQEIGGGRYQWVLIGAWFQPK